MTFGELHKGEMLMIQHEEFGIKENYYYEIKTEPKLDGRERIVVRLKLVSMVKQT
jgi:hypothetical protein